jgi:hypothetical protein
LSRPVKNVDAIQAIDYALVVVRDHTLNISQLDRKGLERHRRFTETLTDLRAKFDQDHGNESYQVAQRHSTAHTQGAYYEAVQKYGQEAGPRYFALAHQARTALRELPYQEWFATCSCGWVQS